MKEKLLNLMKSEGLTSSRLAEILEIQPSGISHILSGRNKPGFDLLQKILRRFPRINPDWLLLDSEIMFRTDDTPVGATGKMQESSDLFASVASAAFSASESIPSPSTATVEKNQPPYALSTTSEVVRVTVFYADCTFES
ncbi:MAG: helix-turn-helix transcriptional regulator, partial [Alistipes sp.]